MGRKKLEIQSIEDDKIRRVMFKKRRVGVLKKAMELSVLTGCEISLSIFWKEDGSLLEYVSSNQAVKTKQDFDVHQYACFQNTHFKLCEEIEKSITKYGHLKAGGEELSMKM